MNKKFLDKLQEKINTFSLKDLYETKIIPSRLYLTDKKVVEKVKTKINVFPTKACYEKYKEEFNRMTKIRWEQLILKEAEKIERRHG